MVLWNFFALIALITFQQYETSAANEPSLCQEFQILRNTIPINELIAITERHYRCDASFRRAMQFVHTGRFAILAARIERSRQYQAMLGVFEKAGVNTTDISTIGSIIDCLILPLPGIGSIGGYGDGGYGNGYGSGSGSGYGGFSFPDKKYEIINNVHVNVHNGKEVVKDDDAIDDYDYYGDEGFGIGAEFDKKSRTLQSYAMDVFRIIPKETFAQTVCKEAASNTQFAQFWKIAENRTFQNQILQAVTSRSFAGMLKTFRAHGIDVPRLLIIIFKIFSIAPLA